MRKRIGLVMLLVFSVFAQRTATQQVPVGIGKVNRVPTKDCW